MLRHEASQLDGQLGMPARLQRRIRVVRLHCESLLVERGGLGGEPVGHVGDVGQRRAAPERECLAQRAGRSLPGRPNERHRDRG